MGGRSLEGGKKYPQRRVPASQADARVLCTPTNRCEGWKQPSPKRPVIGSGTDYRENWGHDLHECYSISRLRERLGEDDHTAKLTPVATRTTELTLLVPPPQGTTHCPEESSAEQSDSGPATGSYPAVKIRD